jgi:two-component system chemotaxis response regulator CheY
MRRLDRLDVEVMVIEDDAFSRRLVETAINKQYRVTALGETENALRTYLQLAPNLLFLDINLPNVSGHDLLNRILALDPKAFVVMLSGNCDRDNVMQAMQAGAKGFVAKPFTRDKLFQYIERCPTIKKATA